MLPKEDSWREVMLPEMYPDQHQPVGRQLLQAARGVQEGGDPAGTGVSYHQVRAIEHMLPAGRPWREALLPGMYPGEHPLPLPLPGGEGKYESRVAQAPPPAHAVEVMR